MELTKLSDAMLEGFTLEDPTQADEIIKAAEQGPLQLYEATHILDTGDRRYLMRDLTRKETRDMARAYKAQLPPAPKLDPPDAWAFKMAFINPGKEYTAEARKGMFDDVPSDPLYWLFAQELQ